LLLSLYWISFSLLFCICDLNNVNEITEDNSNGDIFIFSLCLLIKSEISINFSLIIFIVCLILFFTLFILNKFQKINNIKNK
jgi:hypothetical protein